MELIEVKIKFGQKIMEKYSETAKLNEEKLKEFIPLWSKYYKIKVKDISIPIRKNGILIDIVKIIILSKGRRSVKYWLGTGSYYDNQRSRGGKIEVELLHKLFY